MYLRPQYKTLLAKLSKPPRSLIIVTGPRQVGKTTLVRQTLKEGLISLDSFATYTYKSLDEPISPDAPSGVNSKAAADGSRQPESGWLVRVWEQARNDAVAPDRTHHVLVLDEIQKIERWSDTVKGLWDADRRNDIPLQVVLLGSSPLLVQKGLQESLAGRFERIRLNHWSYEEMKAAFGLSLPEYLYYGGYPKLGEFLGEPDLTEWLQYVNDSLIGPAIERDVLMMRQVDKPALLRQLFELGCLYSSQLVSYTKLMGELNEAENQTTLAGYLELLGSAGLLSGLHKYAKGEVRKRKSPPKLQVLNTALMSATHNNSFERAQADHAYWGRLVESAVGAHLHNTGDRCTRIYYWRENGSEVDFVVERGDMCLAIEVKSTDKTASLKGLEAFAKKFPEAERLVVTPSGESPNKSLQHVSLEEFLQSGPDDWFSWSSS